MRSLAVLGLRAHEAAGLTCGDMAGEAIVLRVHKGAGSARYTAPQVVYPPPDLREELATLTLGQEPSAPLFRSAVPGREPRGLTRFDVSRIVRLAARRAGLGQVRAHDLRHTCGTRLSESGQPIEVIAGVLRHSDVRSSCRYLHATPDRIRAATALAST